MKELLTRIKLRYHEGRGPTLTLQQADQAPQWVPLWVTCHAAEDFDTANTWHGKMPEIGQYYTLGNGPIADAIDTRFTQKADLVMTIPYHKDAGGFATQRLVVSGSPVPQCLSNKIARDQILQAPDFRNLHTKGYFHIVTSSYATMLMGDPELQAVVTAMEEREQAMRAGFANPSNRGAEVTTWRS